MVERITFQGTIFRRYPESKRHSDRLYYVPGITDRQRGIGRLHEEVWKHANGREIPDGHHVHHIDHNPDNNAPSNLECLTADQHQQHHAEDRVGRECSPEWLAHLAAIRPLSADWHRTDEGRKHAATAAAAMWAGQEASEHKCERCGASYTSRKLHGNRFCSPKCKAAARRASGADNIEKTCEHCSAPFTTNRYKPTRFCGKSCSALAQWNS